ncbi:phosphoribosylaminoimidazole carboxylase [[Bacillus] enclensis]|uniref:N5-carboxyaminoimidazole ribonucleotide synthase n=1 Tax=[Bacillus] enclensis TaxID=1402860 RepID=A0A0V8HGH4_9BACI|nr:5-(carboxyamino)imidazole ribonucleotide synthase [[Bacillus] enclensis]KSU61663.1 phosphoribosylaminoimidazole carboxylase [[Bacillus] enclensis]SCC20391.1 5-(carboxyamino)imidazole ribonucleotide synthase [[Bacillus] enclensis]
MTLFKKTILPGQTIGIIGGGQLGRMMALAAKHNGFKIAVLDPSPASPCAQVADLVITAPFDQYEALDRLAEASDVITYEFENIDYDSLKWLSGRAYVPQGAELIRITQDRIQEKAALTLAGVEVAPYAVILQEEDIYDNIEKLGYPAVLKTSRGGYDGKGQFVIREVEEVAEAAALLENGPCVLEKWIPFERELSVIVTRNPDGQQTHFPVVENVHVDNILHETIAPARVSEDISRKAVEMAEKISETLDLVGTLAIEMFLTEDGCIFINELAPRPHNSGHYSIEACDSSQFAQHIKAVCNWPLRKPSLLKNAVMVNLLGEHIEPVMKAIPNQPSWFVHLYGKDVPKQKRKMGHVTILTDDIEQTLESVNDAGVWKVQEKIGGRMK